jgi:hypothetical protein
MAETAGPRASGPVTALCGATNMPDQDGRRSEGQVTIGGRHPLSHLEACSHGTGRARRPAGDAQGRGLGDARTISPWSCHPCHSENRLRAFLKVGVMQRPVSRITPQESTETRRATGGRRCRPRRSIIRSCMCACRTTGRCAGSAHLFTPNDPDPLEHRPGPAPGETTTTVPRSAPATPDSGAAAVRL